MPTDPAISEPGLDKFAIPFGARLAEALIAVVAVGLVTLVYTLLIQRGSHIATTCLYPRRPIEINISRLLNVAWPLSSEEVGTLWKPKTPSQKAQPDSTIQLFYIGKMEGDLRDGLVAKGRLQTIAEPIGAENRRPVWLTSGSPLTRNVVQIIVWEWVSLWLMLLMAISILLFNGFFTNDLNLDSYPRITVTIIYSAAFIAHFFYVWAVSLDFFKLVFAGASWSLLERSKFVIGETLKLQGHSVGASFKFRSIDKANEAYVPTTFDAKLGNPTLGSPTFLPLPPTSSSVNVAQEQDTEPAEDAAELKAALEVINTSQKTEREYATEASRLALDRAMANAMIMMAVTLSDGFASWTSSQFSADTPNNTTTTQIGSLALLASLSLGGTAMFSSAMQLNIMKSAFRNILSLKETKINGLALHVHRKTRPRISSFSGTFHLKPVAFTELNSVPSANVKIEDLFAANRSLGYSGLVGMLVFGPGYAMLPRLSDYDRQSAEIEFDFVAPVEGGQVILTTRETDCHAKGQGTGNLDPVIACYIPDEIFGKESC
ncbi:hypothetical protein J3E68DRAFT_419979 [Trichoderma sp. SZMC 28012]